MNETMPPERRRGFWGFVRQKRIWIPIVVLLLLVLFFSFFRIDGGDDQDKIPTSRSVPATVVVLA
ncbi:MAG TPA: hypothetical protein VIH21_00415 [Dehalococcoidia bacterium]|jgi:hypothetical protein